MRADRWFHTLVVVAVSLSACAGRAEKTGEGAGGGAGAGGVLNAAAGMRTAVLPQDCGYHQQFFCASYEPLTDCYCDAQAPLYPSSCAQPLDFQCRELRVRGGQADYVGCYCGPREFTLDDCAVPESFVCETTWPALADCHCDGPVVSEADCLSGYVRCCQGTEPTFGCQCCAIK